MKISVKQLKQLVRESLEEMSMEEGRHDDEYEPEGGAAKMQRWKYDPYTGEPVIVVDDGEDSEDGPYGTGGTYRESVNESLRKAVKAAVRESLKTTKR